MCPTCKKTGHINIPEDMLTKDKSLTTISIHSGIICQHMFQIYVDRYSVVRGAEPIHFEIKNIEYIHDDGIDDYIPGSLFEEMKTLLRSYVRKDGIAGIGLYNTGGRPLFVALPYNMLINVNILNKTELTMNNKPVAIEKVIITFKDNYRLFLKVIKLYSRSFVIALFFDFESTPGYGNLFLEKLVGQVYDLFQKNIP